MLTNYANSLKMVKRKYVFFSCFIITTSLLHSAQISWLSCLWWSRGTLPTREDAKRPLMDELRNIITHNKVEGCLFFLFTFL